MSDLTTVDCATQSLVKCFSNSVLGVNLTTVLIDMEPWFIAKEVATILGYTKTEKAVNKNVKPKNQRMLSNAECKNIFGDMIAIINEDNDSKTIENTEDSRVPLEGHSNFNSRGMKIINEAGLYSLVLRSRKPEAEAFQDWVVEDVLPSIRKTGSYGLQITKEDLLKLNVLNATDPDARFKALSELEQHHTEQKKALEDKNEQLEADNEILTQERDKAIATKAQISTNREAVAVGRVGGLVTANNRLKDALYGNRNRRTIKAVAIANHLKDKDINHYKLIKYCKEHDLEIIKVPDERFGVVNSYPIEAFKAVYPELVID